MILFIGDVHLYDRTPISRLDNYSETILKKLEEIFKIEANYYIFLGDIFHRIEINREYFSRIISFFEKHKNKNIYTICGNHDLPYSNMNYLKDSMLGNLLSTKFIKLERELLTPKFYIYFHNFGEKIDLSRNFKYDVPTFLISHSFYRQYIKEECIPEKYVEKFDYVVLGHDHKPYDRVGNVFRPGSISRLTSSYEDIERSNINLLYYDEDKEVFGYYYLPVEMDVFNKQYIKLRRKFLKKNKEEEINKRLFNKLENLETIEEVLSQLVDFDKEIRDMFLEIYYKFKKGEEVK